MNQILAEAKNLINSDGNVWLWNSESMGGVHHFLTNEDAQKYIELRRQLSREKGWPEEAYGIGTEADFMAAAKEHERQKKANEVKEYCKHVDELIGDAEREIKVLDGLAGVCRKFDGKVINKRFHDAVTEATGFYSSFTDYFFNLKYYGRGFSHIVVSVSADWSHGVNPYTGEKKEIDPNAWRWNTGERLEAEKAIAVIDYHKNGRFEKIANLKASKKKYAAYLRLARKAEAIMKEMEGYDNVIRDFARDNALRSDTHHSYFWRGF